MKRKIKKIDRDGNCLFRCLAFYLYGNQRFHKKIRTEIVLYVINEWINFEPFILGDSSYSLHIATKQNNASHMGSFGIFGGDVELTAFVKMHVEYCVSVFYHTSDQPRIYSQGQKCIFLLYSGEYDKGHYDILIRKSEIKPSESRISSIPPDTKSSVDEITETILPEVEIEYLIPEVIMSVSETDFTLTEIGSNIYAISIPSTSHDKTAGVTETKTFKKRIRKIAGDGNCLFRCLAFFLHGNQRFHRKI